MIVETQMFAPDFREGVRSITPLLPAAATVAVATGVAASAAGLSPLQTVAMSVGVYFPSVMLVASDLLADGVPTAVVVVTALVVGVRVVILSLSIAPYFERFSTRWKWALAYFLWTPVYALTVERFETEPTADARGYYLGLAVPLWLTVQTFVVVGIAFGARVPSSLELGFIVPLAFVALLRNVLTDASTWVAALVGGGVAVAGSGIPFGLGVVVATVCGVVAGVAASRRERAE
ncbi:MAG: AzlC family ABC transporter permease [Haloplanus sp.]